MKGSKLFVCLVVLLCIPFLGTHLNANEQEQKKRILLKERVVKPKPRSLVNPIEVYQVETSLEIVFNETLGDTELMIYNESMTIVFSKEIDTSSNYYDWIDLSFLSEGVYEIVFEDENGGVYWGEFEVE